MLKKIFDWVRQPIGLIAVGIVFLSIFSFAVYGISVTQQVPEQPIAFPHKTHVALGLQCLYCHSGAAKGPAAGIPSQAKCWACHNQIQKTTTSELLAPLKEAVLSGQSIKWVPVAIVPDFVQFNHRPHIAAGKSCETCHGNMSQVNVAQNPQVFNMGWCLACHIQVAGNDQKKLTQLVNCAACHY